MMKYVVSVLFSLLIIPSIALANTISVGQKPVIVVDGASTQHRICMYAGKQYSVGAMIAVGSYVIVCKNANEYESNGAVQWHQIETKPTK